MAVQPPESYAIDASSLIALDDIADEEGRANAWQIVETLASAGRLRIAPVVLDEVKRNRLPAFRRLNRHRASVLVAITPRVLKHTGDIAFKYPIMSHIDRSKDSGDPWVLGIALVEGCKVICEESRFKEQRMAWACTKEGIPCGNIYEMLTANGLPRKKGKP